MLLGIYTTFFAKHERAKRLTLPPGCIVECKVESGGSFQARAHDLSRTGICVMTTRALHRKEKLDIQFVLAGRTFHARAIVMWRAIRVIDGVGTPCAGLHCEGMATDDRDAIDRFAKGLPIDDGNRLAEDLNRIALRPDDVDQVLRKLVTAPSF